MRLLRDTLACLVLMVLLLLLVALAYFCWQEKDVVRDTLRDTHTTILEIGLTAKNLREASLEWKKASKEQSIQTTLAMSHVSAAAGQLSTFITSTDKSLNVSLFPSIAQAVKSQNASLLKSEALLNGNLSEMSAATQQLQKTLADTDERVNDPAIQKTMDSVAESGAHLASATAHADASMAKIQEGITYEINQLEAPVSKLKAVGLIALTVIRKLYF